MFLIFVKWWRRQHRSLVFTKWRNFFTHLDCVLQPKFQLSRRHLLVLVYILNWEITDHIWHSKHDTSNALIWIFFVNTYFCCYIFKQLHVHCSLLHVIYIYMYSKVKKLLLLSNRSDTVKNKTFWCTVVIQPERFHKEYQMCSYLKKSINAFQSTRTLHCGMCYLFY